MDDFLSIISATWPIFAALGGIVYALIKLHVDQENIKEKIKVLFELWNSKIDKGN